MRNYCCEHCNEQLEIKLVMTPSYDDGGGLDALDVEEDIQDCDCEGAVRARRCPTPMRPPQEPPYETDDLPL